jgi:hypothetical protein
MFNKRYALLGWLTWQVGKRKAAQKAKSAVPSDEGRRPNKALVVSALAAVGAAVFFWRRHAEADDAGDAGDAGEVVSPDQ